MSRKRLLLLLVLSISQLLTDAHALVAKQADELTVQRAHAHLLLKDPQAALSELHSALGEYPQSKSLRRAQIEGLAALGDSAAILRAWNGYCKDFPQEKIDRELLEIICWGIINKGARSPALATRAMALVGAYLGNDARGVAILAKGLRSTNALLRSMTVEIVSSMRDDRLRDEITRMLSEEPVWSIRLEVIRAVGKMKIRGQIDPLEAILVDPNSRAEEKAAAIEALTNLAEDTDQAKMQALVGANRAGLRELACLVAIQEELTAHVELLLPLLDDHSAKIRALTIQAVGAITTSQERTGRIADMIQAKLSDHDPLVSLSAAWVLTPLQPATTLPVFKRWFKDPIRETRLLAAGMLAQSGPYGISLMRQVLADEKNDLYVRANVAMGLLGLRENIPEACRVLTLALNSLSERWMWRERGLFRYLCPSDISHKEGTPNYPETVNQTTRLEVLNALAVVDSPKALESIKHFLQERTWGITGVAASLLLTEGDETTFALIRQLQNDPDKRVRTQAALVLALWGHDPAPVEILQQTYADADYVLKAMILEALGSVGHERSIPFLMETLGEPSEQVRLIAASSLIRCLNH